MTAGTKLLRSSASNLWGDWGRYSRRVRACVRTYCLHVTLKAFPYLASASSTVVMYAGSRVTHEVMLPREGQSSAITCVVAPAPRPLQHVWRAGVSRRRQRQRAA